MSGYTVEVTKISSKTYWIKIEDSISSWSIERITEDIKEVSEKLIRTAGTISESYYIAVKRASEVCLKTKSCASNFSNHKIQAYVEYLLACIDASTDTETIGRAEQKSLKGFKHFCKIVDCFIKPKSNHQQQISKIVQKQYMQNTCLFTIKEDEIIICQ